MHFCSHLAFLCLLSCMLSVIILCLSCLFLWCCVCVFFLIEYNFVLAPPPNFVPIRIHFLWCSPFDPSCFFLVEFNACANNFAKKNLHCFVFIPPSPMRQTRFVHVFYFLKLLPPAHKAPTMHQIKTFSVWQMWSMICHVTPIRKGLPIQPLPF